MSYDQAYGQYQEVHHQGKFSHEAIAGAAAFFGIHEWEKKQRESGQEVSHAKAKEFLGALAAAEADKLFESKGLDKYDEFNRDHAKKQASDQAKELYDQHYGGYDKYNPSIPPPRQVDDYRSTGHEEHRHHHHRED
ncbi:hypothetical protein ABW20_dc0105304 [Dactylellina cionopaga]|nr:hypothetical protein ABW20_dc0105304 [Dactylellina cionopaga]